MTGIRRPSAASRAGLRPGDLIRSCNGQQLEDWIDFARAADSMTARIRIERNGIVRRNMQLRRQPGREWGVSLDGSRPRVCRHRCPFCFTDQLPDGLRGELYVKDDDVRHSFYHGTFISLSSEQVSTALEKGLSPLNVSVHSTEPELRGRLFGHPGETLPVLPALRRLADAGIQVDAQIVLLPGWNDGEHLTTTLRDLLEPAQSVRSVGVVPVGLTDHRSHLSLEGLPQLRRPGRDESLRAIDTIESFQRRSLAELGTRWSYAADELYLLAERPLPPASHYAECPQMANGIGLLSTMLDEWEERAEETSASGSASPDAVVFTAALAHPFIRRSLQGSGYRVVEVPNELFGASVGVAGLLGGGDIIASVRRAQIRAPMAYLPSVMFNPEGLTLDGFTARDIGREIGCRVMVRSRLIDLPGSSEAAGHNRWGDEWRHW